MGKQVNNTFTWVIKNVSTLQGQEVRSEIFVVGGCKWRLIAYPEVNNVDGYLSLSVYLDVPDCCESLPSGWKRHAKFSLTIVNQISEELSQLQEGWRWFDENTKICGFRDMIPVVNLHNINGGFLLNGELTIIAEVEVHEIIDTLNASQVEEYFSDDSSEDFQNKDNVNIEVNGFQVLDSQVDQVNAIFEKHPDLTSNFNLKNQHIKNAYMHALLDLIKTLCKSPKDLTVEDMNKADNTLTDLVKAGLNLDWLSHKLDQALEKQIDYDTRIRELEKQVKKRKLAVTELEADLEKEKAAASASLILFD
ncbi:hypothetical protein ARALYDRAFT_907305 [Arabidopsis lyrata subsp. lyrata]|uniref:MATH domain-containing protein n=1 Tax=Arabidopsis lyrata subsp. lyrata TaxID=81972 RepID=D7LW23_ARALL|nr:MATH domain and coiled-coil domain-containing protein At3g58280 [Arabidopsis lyrata subsp. lyrata]EFH54463.1 hypothetical protein ARALYDRAFT_907305 [Arabidopsis lyrata subsp. lyrata]|eukprot:XP_002878204.1 MATH domain and coiled-coil domain-containing protein At3g58280 [Arabidopsis lyrata subsp. lyrata]